MRRFAFAIFSNLLLVVYASFGAAETFEVTTTLDEAFEEPCGPVAPTVTALVIDGPTPGTLRWAICSANEVVGPDIIAFDIPGEGPHIIRLAGRLPFITEALTLNGYSQPGSAMATEVTPADIRIGLDGLDLSPDEVVGPHGLVVSAPDTLIRGLAVFNFPNGAGIEVIASDGVSLAGVLIDGNLVGTDPSGASDVGNRFGIWVTRLTELDSVSDVTIGGADPADRNVIVGNTQAGIALQYGSAITVLGNWIGIADDGTTPMGNGTGIGVPDGPPDDAVDGLTIGQAGAGNVIAGNTGAAIAVMNGGAVAVDGNRIGVDARGSVEGNGSPLELHANGLVTFTDNLVSNNSGGILVASAGGGVALSNNLFDDDGPGVTVTGLGDVSAVNNVLTGCAALTVERGGGAEALTVTDNTLSGSACPSQFLVHGQGPGTVEVSDNTYETDLGSFQVASGAGALAVEDNILAVGPGDLQVTGSGAITLARNDIDGSSTTPALVDISSLSGGAVTLVDNLVFGADVTLDNTAGSGPVTLTGNELEWGGGLTLSAGGALAFESNLLRDNAGVVALNGLRSVTASANEVSRCGGVAVTATRVASIADNVLSNNAGAIAIDGGSDVSLVGNTLSSNQGAVTLTGVGDLSLTDNVISGSASLVELSSGGALTLDGVTEGNAITSNGGGVSMSGADAVSLAGNDVSGNGGALVVSSKSGAVSIVGNTLIDNADGFSITSAESLSLEGNTLSIVGGAGKGFAVSEVSGPIDIVLNTFTSIPRFNVQGGTGAVTVSDNTLTLFEGALVVGGKGRVSVLRNVVSGDAGAVGGELALRAELGVHVQGGPSLVEVADNSLADVRGPLAVSGSGPIHVTTNALTGNSRGLVVSTSAGEAVTVTDNQAIGGNGAFTVDALGSVTVTGNVYSGDRDTKGTFAVTGGGVVVSGNTVDGNSGGALAVIGTLGATVTDNVVSGNGTVLGGGGAFTVGGALLVSGNQVSDNLGGQVSVSGGDGLAVSGNTFTSNVQGWVSIAGGADFAVTGNTMSGNGAGGLSVTGQGAQITANVVTYNAGGMARLPEAGIWVRGHGNTISGNTVVGNGGDGITVLPDEVGPVAALAIDPALLENEVSANTISGNLGLGIHFSTGGLVTGNDVFDNDGDALWLDGIDVSAQVTLNQLTNNAGTGVWSDAYPVEVDGNLISDNYGMGVLLRGDGHRVRSNVIVGNALAGVGGDGAGIRIGGNTLQDNILGG